MLTVTYLPPGPVARHPTGAQTASTASGGTVVWCRARTSGRPRAVRGPVRDDRSPPVRSHTACRHRADHEPGCARPCGPAGHWARGHREGRATAGGAGRRRRRAAAHRRVRRRRGTGPSPRRRGCRSRPPPTTSRRSTTSSSRPWSTPAATSWPRCRAAAGRRCPPAPPPRRVRRAGARPAARPRVARSGLGGGAAALRAVASAPGGGPTWRRSCGRCGPSSTPCSSRVLARAGHQLDDRALHAAGRRSSTAPS